ncbi:MAG TPA: (2Fe-2S)-binding protein [Gemmatimonadales bacterium]|nr:(2Fe-2S)-binding protein [Gemmatimonadales bacterium]
MNIDRCICTGLTFAEVRARAAERGWDLDAVRRELGAGGQCGLCRPYLRRSLATGETRFHEILTEPRDG